MTLEYCSAKSTKAFLERNGQKVVGREFPIELLSRITSRSKTATAVMKDIVGSKKSVRLMCFRYLKGCTGEYKNQIAFQPDDDNEGIVFVDLDCKVTSTGDMGTKNVPAGLAILHEFGHAIQWMAIGFDKFMGYLQAHDGAYKISCAGQQEDVKYSHTLEWANVTQVEWPICREIQFPQRQHYWEWLPPGQVGSSA